MVHAHGEGPRFEVEVEIEEEPYNVDRAVSAPTCGTEGELGVGVEGGTLFSVEGSIRRGIAEDVEHGEEGGSGIGIRWQFALDSGDGRERGAEGFCGRSVFRRVEVRQEEGRGLGWKERREVFGEGGELRPWIGSG